MLQINDSIFLHPQERFMKFVHNRQCGYNEVKHYALLGTGTGVEFNILVQDEVDLVFPHNVYQKHGDYSKFIFSSPLYD
jgi:hypothetical protein